MRIRNKSIIKRFIVLLISVFFTSCLNEKEEDWITFKNPEEGFEIIFPKEPIKEQVIQETSYGKIRTTIYSASEDTIKNKNKVYAISWQDLPSSSINSDSLDLLFKAIVTNSVESVDGKLIYNKVIELSRHFPGREVRINFNNYAIIQRYYLVATRLFILQILITKENILDPTINKFLQSFSLVNFPKITNY